MKTNNFYYKLISSINSKVYEDIVNLIQVCQSVENTDYKLELDFKLSNFQEDSNINNKLVKNIIYVLFYQHSQV